MRVIVIGAGLGGLTLAHGLRRAGIEVAVYERDGVLGRPQGVSLHVDDRGIAALRECLPPAHVAMVEATLGGAREQTLTLSDVEGELAVVAARSSDGMSGRARPGRQAHRPLLRAVLLTGLDDVVRFGAEFRRFEWRADGRVRAFFADGRTDTADVLVGADGVGSAVRRQYLPDVRVADTGRRVMMGATPLGVVAGLGLPGLIGDDPAVARVGGTTMALGVLRFGCRPVVAREKWLPALGSHAVAEIEDYVMWALPVTKERLGSPAEVWRQADEPHPALRSIVAETRQDVTAVLRIGVIPPMPAWPVTPVTVLGDAIHLAPGFGGNLAMRDANRLREALVEADRGRLDLLDAIGAYEDTMRRDSFPTSSAKASA
ncbi:FAD-dependent oxidoreductase [Amycolatopsis speibonae]|uniref:FAD-dependent oxidoreductase n=1 Tax=Amycolatopsis speibonae TaxID=1450224 RepID=A0ABV7P292_9PSEU